MWNYVNEAHNEVAELEDRLGDLYNAAMDLKNWLYRRNPESEALDELDSVVGAIENCDWETPYKQAQADAGESWWDER